MFTKKAKKIITVQKLDMTEEKIFYKTNLLNLKNCFIKIADISIEKTVLLLENGVKLPDIMMGLNKFIE
ncbi:hypothetical protein GCM10011510_15650 [Streptococcus himalayensis]|uniref:Uncharacterized protein n=1 Tax=Streptococcus himalayensis TaxID=1888195 RepID=A0A917EFZ8_9STRE|nr:hypothetical protein GCM10011510_15650 [Streptococcus himalayensis]